MFEVGFTELLLIFALALVVLGPRRLPELASKVGRWVGKARAMARQLREQLDQEVNFEETEATRRARTAAAAAGASAPPTTPDDTDLQFDGQGRPYYPTDHHGTDHHGTDHHGTDHPASDPGSSDAHPAEPAVDRAGTPRAAQASGLEAIPSIAPPAREAGGDEKTSGEASQPQQAANERRGA